MFQEIVFHLLNIYRKDEAGNSRMLRRVLKRRLVHKELLLSTTNIKFWTALCHSAGLLDLSNKPYPTLLAVYWWGYSSYSQMTILVNAWTQLVQSDHRRKIRRSLLQRLSAGEPLNQSEVQELSGLQALGLLQACRLTDLGRSFFLEKNITANQPIPDHWLYRDERIFIPYPPDWALLWNLEAYLDPIGPGEYSLSADALQRATQRGALIGNFNAGRAISLTAILECGCEQPVPMDILDRISTQPGLRLLSGPVLEASDPETLKKLRKSNRLRPYLDHILSPRHIHLSPWHSSKILRQLRQMGWEVDQTTQFDSKWDHSKENHFTDGTVGRNYFSISDRLYLMSLALFAEGFHAPYTPPPGLLRKLAEGLVPTVLAAADEHASVLLEILYPRPPWKPEVTPPAPPEPTLLDFLQRVIDREESIDILYQTSHKHTPEYRHISPQILEKRNERWYLTAYCHNRRGQRLFRLDRLKVVDLYDA